MAQIYINLRTESILDILAESGDEIYLDSILMGEDHDTDTLLIGEGDQSHTTDSLIYLTSALFHNTDSLLVSTASK